MSSSVIPSPFDPEDRGYYNRFFFVSRHVEDFAKVLVILNGIGVFGEFLLVLFERKSLALWFPLLEVFDFVLLLDGIQTHRMYSLLFCIGYRAVNIMFLIAWMFLQMIFGYTDYVYYDQELMPRALAILLLAAYALYKLYSLKIFGNLLGFYAMRDEFERSRQSQRSNRGGGGGGGEENCSLTMKNVSDTFVLLKSQDRAGISFALQHGITSADFQCILLAGAAPLKVNCAKYEERAEFTFHRIRYSSPIKTGKLIILLIQHRLEECKRDDK